MPGCRPGHPRPRPSLRPLLLGLVACVLAAAPAAATPLPPTPNPLPGSTFQGADGDQDDSAPNIDWQALQAAGVVQHNPDPQAQDDAFRSGSKEDEPGNWDLALEPGGVSPGKDNILDAWSAVRQRSGNTFLYLGFTREASGGATFLTFELNTDDRLWDNGRARVPCRRTGDVLMSYEAQGNDVDVVLQRWITTATDPATGCAETGRLDDFTGLTPNVDAQGAINAAAIASRLPAQATPDPIPGERFGETALNLARLLQAGFNDDCLAFRSVWMHSRSSTSEGSNMQDYVAPQPLDVSTCAASGTKFFDRDADGVRDPDDPGIPRFVIFADYDENGQLDPREPRTITDSQGHYVLHDIRPPDGTYRLRETLLARQSRKPAVALDWICSFPTTTGPNGRLPCAWGPFDVGLDPNVRRRDFGNWFPAQLTLEKQFEPADDPGPFDLLVDGEVVLAGAGDGASTTIGLPPDVYDISEVAVAGTDGAAYRSTVECRRNPTRRGSTRSGTVFEGLALAAGDRASCTFRNIRPGAAAIAIRKVGPSIAEAGDTLPYTLYVTNPGDVSFPAAAVVVSDPECDDRPQLAEKQDGSGADDTPDTLDPGDTWIYRCSRGTSAGAGCEPTRVDNPATATGTAGDGAVEDGDSISTILLCPEVPPPPTPVPPGPGPEGSPPSRPGPVVPPGRRPPNAGDVAAARFLFRQATGRCITNRVPRVNFSGTHIRRVRVFVNGRLRRNLNLRTLQRRVTPRVTLAPGRYRVTARVAFTRGAGTPPLTLSHVVRICAAAQPRFTG